MRSKVVILMFVILAVAQLSFAQEAPPVTFSFQPPGARSLGMGAAFLGLADDATAAEANPAGLILLSQMEVSAHYRDSSSEQFFTSAFTASGESFGADSSADDLSFVSFVKPWSNWSLSAYFAQNANIDSSGTGQVEGGVLDPDVTSFQSLQLEAYGVSLAYRLHERLSAGLTIRSSQLDASFSQIAQFPSGDLFSDEVTVAGDDDDVTFLLGFLINPGGRLSVGVVYESGGEYDLDQFRVTESADGRTDFEPIPVNFEVPDVLGLGLAWRPTDRIVVLFDAKDISYGDLNPLFEALTEAPRFENVEKLGLSEVELNLGIEYTVPASWGAVFLRAGAISDPDHDGFRDQDTEEIIPTAGLGLVGRGGWQLDVGASFGDKSEDLIASFIYRF